MNTATKRTFDLVLTICVLPFALPIMLVALVVIKITSPGPVLYWSDRIGKNNAIFSMPKLRTMLISAPEVATDLLEDPRQWITPIGRILRLTSIDELPQLFSVLSGDMSLVGPRPALHNQNDLIAMRTAAGIHKLKPGLTGWAQINGRDDIDLSQKVHLDSTYLQKQSLYLDTVILLKTVGKLIHTQNIRH